MKEHGLLFKDEMIRALIAGLKTETRRAMSGVPEGFIGGDTAFVTNGSAWAISRSRLDPRGAACFPERRADHLRHRYGEPGSTMWAREVWGLSRPTSGSEGIVDDEEHWQGPAKKDPRGSRLMRLDWHVGYRATSGAEGPWRSSLLMPRWAARITATIVEVVPQWLGDITEADAAAEGMALVAEERGWPADSLREVFFRYFEEIHKAEADPRMPVWVIRFRDVVTSGQIPL